MKLFYYKGNNFGDKLNPIIWDAMVPGLIDEDEGNILVGIGTLINSNVPAQPQKAVFGSGAGYMNPATIDDKWKFYCVRGPLTADVLGLDRQLAITDPALLLNQIYTSPVTRGTEVCFMPHHVSANYADWERVCANVGITYLDPAGDTNEVIEKIRGAKLVIAEAMHAAIVADAFRIPWVPVQCYDHILGFKWQDWCDSMQLPYRPETIPSLWDADRHLTSSEKTKTWVKRGLRSAGIWSNQWTPPLPPPNLRRLEDKVVAALQRLADGSLAYLSNEKTQMLASDRLMEQLACLARDYAKGPVGLRTTLSPSQARASLGTTGSSAIHGRPALTPWESDCQSSAVGT
jgi:succinoglycan biosynthesis protein ExoV